MQAHQEILPVLFDTESGISHCFSRSDGGTRTHEWIEHDPFTEGERSIHNFEVNSARSTLFARQILGYD